MKDLFTTSKLKVKVPENINEDTSQRFDISKKEEAKKYYDENGYVIFSGLIDEEHCDLIRSYWETNIKNYNGKIYRQTGGKAEINKFNENNWVMNPILNIQSLNSKKFKNFKNFIEKNIFNNNSLSSVLKNFLSQKPKIIQSMYFEGNCATKEHQDTYFLDSNHIGALTAAWISLEEIKADAGRFFIINGSHKIDIKKNKFYNDILSNHDKYIQDMISTSFSLGLEIKAPYLNKGDVLFWNSKTIHGSLDSQSKTNSRSSITLHAIPENHKFLHWHKDFIETPVDDLGNVLIYRRKNQNVLKNRIIFFVESNFPKIFYWLKNNYIKIIHKQSHYN